MKKCLSTVSQVFNVFESSNSNQFLLIKLTRNDREGSKSSDIIEENVTYDAEEDFYWSFEEPADREMEYNIVHITVTNQTCIPVWKEKVHQYRLNLVSIS